MRTPRSTLTLTFAVLTAAIGCSSSNSGNGGNSGAPTDGGADGPAVIHRIEDGASGDDGSTPLIYDGTSGLPCKTSTDCIGPDGGAGLNVCSNTLSYTVAGVKNVELWSTPVCIVAPAQTGGNCNPAPSGDPLGQFMHFCDGPDKDTSPGLCVVADSTGTVGICLPKCTFAPDGTAASGCPGKTGCLPITFTSDSNNNIVGYGVCQGYCQTDADCTGLGAGFGCQVDLGFCTKTKVTRTKHVGDVCNPAATTATCNCTPSSDGTTGYCTTACVVGDTACPAGYVCDNGTPEPLDFGTGTTTPVQQNVGTQGTCVPACSLPPDAGAPVEAGVAVEAGASADAGAQGDAAAAPPAPDAGVTVACPLQFACSAGTAAGPDCQPQ
jgi:hypothetical protein